MTSGKITSSLNVLANEYSKSSYSLLPGTRRYHNRALNLISCATEFKKPRYPHIRTDRRIDKILAGALQHLQCVSAVQRLCRIDFASKTILTEIGQYKLAQNSIKFGRVTAGAMKWKPSFPAYSFSFLPRGSPPSCAMCSVRRFRRVVRSAPVLSPRKSRSFRLAGGLGRAAMSSSSVGSAATSAGDSAGGGAIGGIAGRLVGTRGGGLSTAEDMSALLSAMRS